MGDNISKGGERVFNEMREAKAICDVLHLQPEYIFQIFAVIHGTNTDLAEAN